MGNVAAHDKNVTTHISKQLHKHGTATLPHNQSTSRCVSSFFMWRSVRYAKWLLHKVAILGVHKRIHNAKDSYRQLLYKVACNKLLSSSETLVGVQVGILNWKRQLLYKCKEQLFTPCEATIKGVDAHRDHGGLLHPSVPSNHY